MEFKKIEIDIETARLIELNRVSFSESENDIIKRELFRIANDSKSIMSDNTNDGLMWKGCFLPNGLKLRKMFKGDLLIAEVKNGRIVYNGISFYSPSAAAIEASGTNVNGWLWWEYFDVEKDRWQLLNSFRKFSNYKNK